MGDIPSWIKGVGLILALVGGSNGLQWKITEPVRTEGVQVAGAQQTALDACYNRLDACYEQLRQCR